MASSLINLLGFTVGAVLYAMWLWMVFRSSSDRLSLVTGVLGLFWNLGAFYGYGLYTIRLVGPSPLLLAVAFSALGFLPAVVVHSVLRSRHVSAKTAWRSLLALAYALSVIAAALHVISAAVQRTAPSQSALLILTAGFIVVMIVLLLSTPKTSGWGQSFWVVSLAVFAVSALHLSNHQGTDPWWLELVGHHSSVPLALAFLHQDYRFALADIFLKRAMALVVLVSIVFGIYLTGITSLSDQQSIVVLVLWVSTALVYPWIRSLAGWFVDNVVLHRPDYDMLLAEASRAVGRHEKVDPVLEELRQLLSAALSARSIEWSKVESFELSKGIVSVVGGRTVIVRIPTVDAPYYSLTMTSFEGGRRLLSDDIAVIERLAHITARRIDAVRTTQERIQRNDREREMSRLAAEAELRALRAQLHPHFLFNALTTIGYLIQTAPDRAINTLMRLSGLLRSVLRSGPEFSTLGEELKIISAYLDIEHARFEDRLVVRIDVSDDLKQFRIPGLLLQPIVENAIKHGISKSSAGGEIRITAELVSDQPRARLRLIVVDTGAGNDAASIVLGRQQGVGLNNVEKRLQCYGNESGSLRISSKPGEGTQVEITLPAESVESDGQDTVNVMEKAGHAR